ncbi:unnamed protein product [Diamesa serratosioi]
MKESSNITFNTTIDSSPMLDHMIYYFNDMKSEFGYNRCKTEDLNPFHNCTPINCAMKYFGKRNFFNSTKGFCESVPNCDEPSNAEMIYDYTNNECVDLSNILTENDIEEIKAGNYLIAEEDDEEYVKQLINPRKPSLKCRFQRSIPDQETSTKQKLLYVLYGFLLVSFSLSS